MAKVSLRAYNRDIEAMIDRGQLDEAVAHCQHILKTFPKHLETYRLLGKAYLEARRHNEAVDIFSRVLVSEPSDFVAQVGMSIIRDEQNKLDDAIWHMERAFESQPSNAAIQGELQRLYGRRDGVQPPRIRMTRGALANMYMQGELYPQAISEARSVLGEDQARSDMQVLLAKAYFKSGQKNNAADAATTALKRYPYCLDANRVLADILGADKVESAQVYRKRVVELDPYSAHVNSSMFQSKDVNDAAVMIDSLDWNGQPSSSDWGKTGALSLGSGNEQPDWLRNAMPETTSSAPSGPLGGTGSLGASASQPKDDIPDFLKAAGWGESTGSFDESKSIFDDEPVSSAEPLTQGDLPEWVKAMKPAEDTPAQPQKDEELPDWINKIGTGALPVTSVDQDASDEFDWLNTPPSSPEPQTNAADDQPDWLRGAPAEEPASEPVAGDQPSWMQQLGEESKPQDEEPNFDFLNQTEAETSQPAPIGTVDDLGKSEDEVDDALAWFEGLAAKQGATEGLLTNPEDRLEQEPDWVKQVKGQQESQPPAQEQAEEPVMQEPMEEEPMSTPSAQQPSQNADDLGKSGQEIDDALAWFESLAAKQGATEGLLTKPEERLDQEPDWVKQAKGQQESQPPVAQEPIVQQPVAEEKPVPAAPAPQPTQSADNLGKSGEEIDDALAWFESLAAKQGATEGLLTKPEERLEQEPEWVKQAKGQQASQPPAVQEPVVQQPAAEERPIPAAPAPQPTQSADDLGKSGEEIDDALAWFESLAAKQGATEGLLTKPEERLEQEPEWVKQAKQAGESQTAKPVPEPEPEPEAQKPAEPEEEPEWMKHARAVGEQFFDDSMGFDDEEAPAPVPTVSNETSTDDVSSWLRDLDKEEKEKEPEPVAEAQEDTSSWLRSLGEPEEEEPTAVASVNDDVPAWMREDFSEEQTSVEESTALEEEASVPSDDVPSWLSGLAEEEPAVASNADDDVPAWMRDETGEVVAEPTKIEPTRATDWMPVDAKEEEPAPPPPAPKPATPQKAASQPKQAPVKKPIAQKPAPAATTPPPTPAYKEPVTRRGTGLLQMPVDPVLGSARAELSRSNIPGALDTYEKLIKKGRFLEEVIYDLREALYRYPVEVSIWQTLGDAYMRANQLQDALDAYTKAEELLR